MTKFHFKLVLVFCFIIVGALAGIGNAEAADTRPDLIPAVSFKWIDDGIESFHMPVLTILNLRGRAVIGEWSYYVEWKDKNGEIVSSCNVPMNTSGNDLAVLHPLVHDWYFCLTDENVHEIKKATKFKVILDYHSSDPSLSDRINETNEANNSLSKDIPLADLAVVSVNFRRDQYRSPVVIIMNKGRGHTGTFFTSFQWLDKEGNELLSCPSQENSLSPGQIRVFNSISCGDQFDNSMKYAKAVKFRVTVDRELYTEAWQNMVNESNENNNVWEGNIPAPDLVVAGVSFKKDQYRTPVATIMNRGRGYTGTFFTSFQWLDENGNELLSCPSQEDPLGPGQIRVFSSISCGSQFDNSMKYAKAVKFRVTVDRELYTEAWQNMVHESNENNNVWEGNIPAPDLVATIIKFKNDQYQTPVATIMNKGRGYTGTFFTSFQWLDSEGNELLSCPSQEDPLGPGQFRVFSSITCGNQSENSGKYAKAVKFRVTVDRELYTEAWQNMVYESNENNNILESAIPRPDLKIEGINFKGTNKYPEITIINKSDVAVDFKTHAFYEWFDVYGQRTGDCHADVPKLGPNKRFVQKKPFCGDESSYLSAVSFQATVDTGPNEELLSEVVESNEDNNSLKWPIPGRVSFNEVTLPPLIQPTEQVPFDFLTVPNTPVVETPFGPILDNLPTLPQPEITIPTPEAELPSVNVPEISDSPITVPDVPSVPTTPVVTPPPDPTPTVDIGDKYPSFTAEISDDGLATFTMSGHFNYYGTKKGCEGPRYFTPIIAAWGQVDTYPVVDSNNNYTTTHKYNVRNAEYIASVSFINSCFQRTTKRFVVHPKL